jgi:hypothetical protein
MERAAQINFSAQQIVEVLDAPAFERNRVLVLDILEPWSYRLRPNLQYMRPPLLRRTACQMRESRVASQSIQRHRSHAPRPMRVLQENSEIDRRAAENFQSILSVLVAPSRGDLRWRPMAGFSH